MANVKVFQKLLESIKTNCPGVISEQVQDQMTKQFNDAISDIQKKASDEGYAAGQNAGFKDGYEEGKRIAAEKAKADFDKIVDQCDEEAVAKIQEILDLVDTQTTEKLEEVYQMLKDALEKLAVAEQELSAKDQELSAKDQELSAKDQELVDKLTEKDEQDAVKLQTYAEAVDKKHAQQIEEAINAVDKKHALVLQHVIKELDENNSKKLQQVVNLIKESANKRMKKMETIYEEKLKAEKEAKVDILAESVEKYINYALEQHIPKKELVSEQKYNTALKTLDKISNYLKVNGIIQESKEEVFNDYEKQLAEAKSAANKLIGEKIELADKLNKKEAQLVLESKLTHCTPAEAKFLRNYFAKATSPRIIEESIEDAKASFRKYQAEKRAALQASLKTSKKPSAIVTEAKTVQPTSKLGKESKVKQIKQQESIDIAQYYANYLKRK